MLYDRLTIITYLKDCGLEPEQIPLMMHLLQGYSLAIHELPLYHVDSTSNTPIQDTISTNDSLLANMHTEDTAFIQDVTDKYRDPLGHVSLTIHSEDVAWIQEHTSNTSLQHYFSTTTAQKACELLEHHIMRQFGFSTDLFLGLQSMITPDKAYPVYYLDLLKKVKIMYKNYVETGVMECS